MITMMYTVPLYHKLLLVQNHIGMKEIMMVESKTLWLQLTTTEANALMIMLDSEMETRMYDSLDLREWETLDLEAYKMLAFHKYKTWYTRNCDE
jgi:hypothetical protein